jgi:hypothetical protein
LQKRGQYVATNELLEQLNKQFGSKTEQYPDGHPLKTKDSKQIDNDAFPFPGDPTLTYAHFKQNLERELDPTIAS